MGTKNNQVHIMESGQRETFDTESGISYHNININNILRQNIELYLLKGETGNGKSLEGKKLPGESKMWIHRVSRSGYRLVEIDGIDEMNNIDEMKKIIQQKYPGIYHGYVTYGKRIFFIISQSKYTPTNFESMTVKSIGDRIKDILEGGKKK